MKETVVVVVVVEEIEGAEVPRSAFVTVARVAWSRPKDVRSEMIDCTCVSERPEGFDAAAAGDVDESGVEDAEQAEVMKDLMAPRPMPAEFVA